MKKTISGLRAPAYAGVVRETTTRAAIAQIKNCLYDCADMIDLHMSCLEDSSVEELKKIEGLGDAKICSVLAAVELGRRISTAPREKRISITSSEQIAKLFIEDMRYESREVFKALLLNPKGEILSAETVSIGELTSTPVHPREVFAMAIKRSAAAIVLVHNHPSGDSSPSEADLDVTARLVACGKIIGINVIDHIIIGDGQFSSLQSLGYMKNF